MEENAECETESCLVKFSGEKKKSFENVVHFRCLLKVIYD